MPTADTPIKVKQDHFRMFWEWLHRVKSSSLTLLNNFTVYSACTCILFVILGPDWIGKYPNLYHLSIIIFSLNASTTTEEDEGRWSLMPSLPRWPCVNLCSVCLTGSHREWRHDSRGSNSRKSKVMCVFLISWVVFFFLSFPLPFASFNHVC